MIKIGKKFDIKTKLGLYQEMVFNNDVKKEFSQLIKKHRLSK